MCQASAKSSHRRQSSASCVVASEWPAPAANNSHLQTVASWASSQVLGGQRLSQVSGPNLGALQETAAAEQLWAVARKCTEKKIQSAVNEAGVPQCSLHAVQVACSCRVATHHCVQRQLLRSKPRQASAFWPSPVHCKARDTALLF